MKIEFCRPMIPPEPKKRESQRQWLKVVRSRKYLQLRKIIPAKRIVPMGMKPSQQPLRTRQQSKFRRISPIFRLDEFNYVR